MNQSLGETLPVVFGLELMIFNTCYKSHAITPALSKNSTNTMLVMACCVIGELSLQCFPPGFNWSIRLPCLAYKQNKTFLVHLIIGILFSVYYLEIRSFLPQVIIFERLFGARIKKPSSTNIIVLSDEGRDRCVGKLDWRELILVVQGKGTCNPIFQEVIIVQQYTNIWKEGYLIKTISFEIFLRAVYL